MSLNDDKIIQKFMLDFYDDITDDPESGGFDYCDEDGTSIFVVQFDRYWNPYFSDFERFETKLNVIKYNLIDRMKFLYKKCKDKIGLERTVRCLERIDKVGNSLPFIICREFSSLFDWMVQLDIKPNTIHTENNMTPFFRFSETIEYLLQKGVSPYIHYENMNYERIGSATSWRCQREDFHHNFEDNSLSEQSKLILKDLMAEKQLCHCNHPKCSKPSVKHVAAFSPYDYEPHFKAFYTKQENMVPLNCYDARLYGNMIDLLYHKTSMILKTTWNGQDAVMKCKYIPTFTDSRNLLRPEFEAVKASREIDCVLAPLAYFRQQYVDYKSNVVISHQTFHESRSDEQLATHFQKNRILNFDVIVLPRLQGNLRELKSRKNDHLSANELRIGLVLIFEFQKNFYKLK